METEAPSNGVDELGVGDSGGDDVCEVQSVEVDLTQDRIAIGIAEEDLESS